LTLIAGILGTTYRCQTPAYRCLLIDLTLPADSLRTRI
jgi:hypothetical protein